MTPAANPGHLERLRECLSLAARARGATSPNPMVGAVVVRDSQVVGSAYHERAGTAHAERIALERAGDRAHGATLFTNMEPCSHHGRTPPCVDAIVAHGVARVVASLRDPDPRVDGRGFARLREAGVEVIEGVAVEEAAELNAAYLQAKRTGRPLVVAKAALSLDGRMATAKGDSQWITGPSSRAHAHALRAASDAVVVGVGTALADDPRLTARGAEGAGPAFRVVVDSQLRIPADARLFGERAGAAVVITTGAALPRAAAIERAGGRVVVVDSDPSGRVDLLAALASLAESGVNQVMIEGGGRLLTSAFELGIIDRVVLFYGPLLIGGLEAPTIWGGSGSESMHDALRLRRVRTRCLDPDWVVDGWLRLPRELEDTAT